MTEKTNAPSIDDQIQTLNPMIGVSVEDLTRSTMRALEAAAFQPAVAAQHLFQYNAEVIRIMFGSSERQPSPKDRRFQDTNYADNPYFAALLKNWLAWQSTVCDWVEAIGLEGKELERARYLATIVTDAMAPSNFLPSNPSALKKAFETRGASLVAGLQNLIADIVQNQGMPSQVDKSAFKVGGNIANTPGSVIHRDDILEIIQYQSSTGSVNALPILIVPPQINKFYLYDLGPDKSVVKYLTEQGFQVFMVSWRNPTPEHRNWGLDSYVASLERAIDVTRDVARADAVNVVGACAGGITLAVALAYLAGKKKLGQISSITLMVNVLQPAEDDSVLGLFSDDDSIEAARKRSAQQGVLDGNDTARIFNWMRPNDLIWNYVVSNYLHGETPPAFDILYWNSDTTRLPARLHSDFLDIFKDGVLSKQGELKIGDVAIDLSKVTVPAFITGGTTDHITPWHACYRTTQLWGGETTYVLSTAGHIQSLINPPELSKRKYMVNPETPPSAEDWLKNAEEHSGSWWPFWVDWLKERSGELTPAPAELGSQAYPELGAAPGTYVLE